MSKKKRGRPPLGRINTHTTGEELEQLREDFRKDFPSTGFVPDGKGIDFRLPLPPWDEAYLKRREINLAILRVDPYSTNRTAYYFECFPLAICQVNSVGKTYEKYFRKDKRDESDVCAMFYELLAQPPIDAKSQFDDIMKMQEALQEPPHRNFVAYMAYCDFLEEFGFDPSMPRLTRFISDDPEKYPVGISTPPSSKEWWTMYFEAGLVRIGE